MKNQSSSKKFYRRPIRESIKEIAEDGEYLSSQLTTLTFIAVLLLIIKNLMTNLITGEYKKIPLNDLSNFITIFYIVLLVTFTGLMLSSFPLSRFFGIHLPVKETLQYITGTMMYFTFLGFLITSSAYYWKSGQHVIAITGSIMLVMFLVSSLFQYPIRGHNKSNDKEDREPPRGYNPT